MNTEKNTVVKKPKVAIIHYSGPPNISGVDSIVKDQARLFRLNNYRADIVVGSGKRFRKDIPVKINKLINPKNPFIYKIRQQLEKGQVSNLYRTTENKLYNYLRRYINKNGIGVFIVHNLFTRHYNLPLTAAILRLSEDMPQLKIINWVHDITFFNQKDLHLDKNLSKMYPWNILVTYHPRLTYVCVSEFLKKDLLSSFNTKVDQNLVKVIPNTHDIQKFLGLSPNMRQLYVRLNIEESDLVAAIPVRAVPRKRLELAVSVAQEIVNRGINFKLLLTANMDRKRTENIEYYNSIKKQIIDLKLTEHVFLLEEYFQQFASPGRPMPVIPIPELLLISDCLILPSSLEGFGMPLIEAGLMRCPIFASDIPPFKEIGTTNINYFKLEDSPKKVAEFILKKIQSMPQSYFYRKIIKNYSMHKIFREQVLPVVGSPTE